MSCAEIRRGVDIRLISAVETLRALQADGFSVDAIVEVALGKRTVPGDRPADEHPLIVQLYREAIGEAPRRPSVAPMEPVPVDPEAPVFNTFISRWPGALADNRENAAMAWRSLTARDQRDAIAGIPAFLAERRAAGFVARLSASAYLRGQGWRGLK